MALKKGDFVELEYTGRVKGSGQVFDTTIEKVAEEEGIFSPEREYKPMPIIIGENHLIKGLDEFLEGKKSGKHKVSLPEEKAFGKKSGKLLKLMPMSVFKKEGVKPEPGMQINVDNQMGLVKSVSGGRVVVDFNHPLAGQDVEYELEVKRVMEDEKEKAEVLVEMFGIPSKKVIAKDGKVEIETEQALPKEAQEMAGREISRLLGVKVVDFKSPGSEDES